ncbi:MAG: hypothetical protein VB081_10120 [Christensenella sp.]|uniref:hypothetical protein n=1 Tax=Christensenella sp. TaxID=1935934 RepID=UPI002B20301F|nr:hypothetical protein [Christensenella sp.]MEA5003842.1 hypothetical protein [Christensenella sp.]
MQDIENKLYQYAGYQRRLKELREQADEILGQHNTLLDGLLKSPCLEDVRVQGGFTSDPVFSAVQKMIDVYGVRLDAIRNEITDIFYHIDEIDRLVNDAGLTENERRYVQLRYFDGMQPKQISFETNYCDGYLREIKKSALCKITAV